MIAAALISGAGLACAEEWVDLGGMGFELDTSSVDVGRGNSSAWIRKIAATEQGQLATHMLVIAHCGQDLLEIERGVLESDWSSKIVEMPELPPEDRFMAIPVKNPAFNNLYAYLCR
ncbi:hypothetical protein [Amaricoccus sp.]|uniref:hypothetical protein n=1 Tax=Amaricoccus sp. TaxID=1872485 RepID=UPI001B7310AA|nr:hypothetical protein [Amaricoccus sp.]MBP7002797.1 hypothetical protein [Amaricoccus sp.]